MIYRHMNDLAWAFVRFLVVAAIGVIIGTVLGIVAAGLLLVALPTARGSEITPKYTELAPVLEFKVDHWEISYANVRALSNAHVIVCFVIRHEHYAECFYVNDEQDIALIAQPMGQERT